MKKVLSFVLCLSLVAVCCLVFAACGDRNKKDETEITSNVESGDEIVGGRTNSDSPVITDDFKKVFDKAVSELDSDYTPVAYLGNQIVAGKNHRVLCKTPATYSILYIYEDLSGNAVVTDIVPSGADAKSAESGFVGGWAEPESPEMTDDAKTALEKACETLTGAEYTPIALLATQVVAGKNYRIICESKPSVPSSESGYVIVTVYADLMGNAEITDTVEFQNKDNNSPEASETSNAAGKVVDGNMKTYYEMNDGTWMCNDVVYKYRLEISGRMPNAAVDSTFVYLSNIEEIPFDRAYKAAGVSSDANDYFSPGEAVLVEMK
ncbi:MAG: hypothetical protein K6F09_01020 [Clostridiales bacterium]|nr:hypothetical protein [Clostridiales bacterium]